MSMKKYLQNFWVRFLACILCSVAIVTGVGAGVLVAGVTVARAEKDIYKNGQEIIAEHYAAYIYDNISAGGGDAAKDSEHIEKLLTNKNFTCCVGMILGGESEEITGTEALIYNNLQDTFNWDYEFRIIDGSFVRYDVDTVLNALRINSVIHDYTYTEEASITGYYFDETTGLFYYKAGKQFFLVDYVMVSHGGNYYDYKLKNGTDGNKIYYNSYYDINLDTSVYHEWDWVELNGHRHLISMEEYPNANEIHVLKDGIVKENIYTGVYYTESYDNIISYHPERLEDIYIIRIKVNDDVTNGDDINHDMFLEWKLLLDRFYENESLYQVVLMLSIVLFLISFALLVYSAKDKKEELGLWYRLPVGCFTAGFLLIEVGLLGLIFILVEAVIDYPILSFQLSITLGVLCVFAMAFFVCLWLQNIITRFKTKNFIRYSEFYYGFQFLKWCWVKWKWLWSKMTSPFRVTMELARENTKLFTRGLVIMLVITFIECLAINMFHWDYDFFMMLFFLEKVIEFLVIAIILLQMQKLQEGSKRIAAGDLSEPIDTSKMFWEFKKHGENINKVSDGIALAVDERMKSERFKTELITNVSHDIKTPLTSIINYVDLIKKQDVQDETLQEYIDVLDRQSARLKKLIEDLMEASKASTGNLTVNMEDCDVEVLLTQLIGEFEEKLSVNQLEVVVQKPEHPVFVTADGRHLWRVFDNLLNNACKYSLPGTRVYISLVQMGNEATIIFKNISKAALNIPSEELMERFVRGDSSRNTEGSGLGLSIAQSLTELMKGSMKLEIDGDLFKVTLKFQANQK